MLKENCRAVSSSNASALIQSPTLWRARSAVPRGYEPRGYEQRRKPLDAFPANGHGYTITHTDQLSGPHLLAPSIRVLIVDQCVIVHAGLRSLLAEAQEMVIVGEATHGSEALQLAAHVQPNVILIDPMMPEMGGIETIRRLRQLNPACQIVVLTAASEEQSIHAALQAGAIGYLLKDVFKSELLRAIRTAVRGEPTLHPTAQRVLMRHATSSPFKDLTARELDVLRLIVQGSSNRTIATTLCLTEGTVKGYVSTILAKLQVADRTQAALYAVKHGLKHDEL